MPLIVLLAAYFTLGFYLLPLFQYQINADGAPLLAIAKAIKAGDFYHSVNAYWGILSSLLLVPFLYLENIQPLLVIKLSNLFIGAFGLLGFYLLSGKFIQVPFFRWTVTAATIPVILYFAYFVLSGDLLIVTLLLHYLNLVFDLSFPGDRRRVLLAGLLGGLLVLAKEYFLYFLPLHLGIIAFLTIRQSQAKRAGRKYLRAFLPGAAVMLVISLTWAGLLTDKYQTFMFGSKGAVNFKIFGPETASLPMFTQGLITPPNPFGVSSWDDPTLLEMKPWHPFASESDILYLLSLIPNNSARLFQAYHSFSLVLIPLLFISSVYLAGNWRKILKSERIFLFTFLTVIAYPVGYMIIYTENRYLWPNYLLVILLAGFLISKIRHFGFLILLVILLTFIKTPVSYLKNYQNVDHTFYDQSKALRSETEITGRNIASNGNWHQTLYFCIYLNCRYFGAVNGREDYGQNIAELTSNKIDYYLSWNDDSKIDSFRKDFKEIKVAEISNLRIFKLRD